MVAQGAQRSPSAVLSNEATVLPNQFIETQFMRDLYRSVVPGSDTFSPRGPFATRRIPAYVPYLVDNLWEWKRPEEFPSRRYAVLASPSPVLAVRSGPSGGYAFRVDIRGAAIVAQVSLADSRDHHECRSLCRMLKKLLGQNWIDADLHVKQEAGPLYIPCLSKAEIEELFSGGALSRAREEVWNAIHYWENVHLVGPKEAWPQPDGEVFFVADQGSLTPEPSNKDE